MEEIKLSDKKYYIDYAKLIELEMSKEIKLPDYVFKFNSFNMILEMVQKVIHNDAYENGVSAQTLKKLNILKEVE